MNKSDRTAFLPVSKEDMAVRGIEQLDFVYISGDAYVDHPSFGTAIISRILEANGFTVGIIAQPNWRDPESVCTLGEPKLGFLVSAGNMDSMVNHYSVAKKRRRSDFFSPGGKMGLRPDYGRHRIFQPHPAARLRKRPSSSAASRPACAALRIMITGRTK